MRGRSSGLPRYDPAAAVTAPITLNECEHV